jgi:iron complex transport system ATP-binding protein
MIRVSNISFRYVEEWVLKNISFDVKKGEFLGIIGPNGSGKTTLLKSLNRTLTIGKGDVFINGTNIKDTNRRELARIVGMVPQETSLVFPFTVLEVVLMGRAPYLGRLSFEGEKDYAIARDAMEMTDTLSFATRSINELSGGERQRVLIARALAQQPQIILLDESTAYLDIKHQIAFFDLIKTLNREEGLTVVAVTHDVNLASIFCDRVMLLSKGAVHCIGTPGDIITEPNIKEVYEADVLVDTNPQTGLPRVTLLASSLSDKGRRSKADAAPQL